jgi:hypothetical protein
MSHIPSLCITIDTPTSLNGYPYFAEVLHFVKSNRKSVLRYNFNYRIKGNRPFVTLFHDQKEDFSYSSILNPMESFAQEVTIKDFNKVGVMTLEDSYKR